MTGPCTTTHFSKNASAIGDGKRRAISIPKYCDASVASYEYGLRLDKDCIPLVSDQISKARALYNKIVACIRDIVGEMQAYVIAQGGSAAAGLEARIDDCNGRFTAAKARNDEPAMREIALERRGLWTQFAQLLGALRKDHQDVLKTRFYARIGRNAGTDTYRLRAEAVADGLGWATANAVLDIALLAYTRSSANGRAPRFSVGAEKTQDALTLQFTTAGGVLAADILGGRHREIALVPTNGVGHRKYGEFRFRLGPAAAQSNATGTCQYHRPLPEGTRIALARLVRKRIGHDTRWTVQLTVRRHPAPLVVSGSRNPLVTVHFGWATDTSGRRVAGLAVGADPGSARLVQLPTTVEEQLQRASAIQAMRDAARDEIVAKLKALPQATVPAAAHADFTALVKLAAQHVSQRRIGALCAKWGSDLADLPDWLRQWRHDDRLRWQASAHIARRARMRRRDFYRVLAAELANTFEVVAIEPLDLATAAKKIDENTGERIEFGAKGRAGRTVAAVSELESAIRWACAKRGTVVLDVAAPTASTCAICGGVLPDKVDRADRNAMQATICPQCGANVDRKRNAAAVAWQIVSSDRDAWVERYHFEAAAAKVHRDVSTALRKANMAAARNARRTALQEIADASSVDQIVDSDGTWKDGK